MKFINSFIVEGLMIKIESLKEGTVLQLEYKDDSFLDILFFGDKEKELKDNFKQFNKCRIVGRFIANQGLFAEHIDFMGVKNAE